MRVKLESSDDDDVDDNYHNFQQQHYQQRGWKLLEVDFMATCFWKLSPCCCPNLVG